MLLYLQLASTSSVRLASVTAAMGTAELFRMFPRMILLICGKDLASVRILHRSAWYVD